MTVEYAPRGLYGVLTPQANTTVEPELAVLTPVGYAWINGRLTSGQATIEQRLVDYYDTLEASLAQFANAPVKAVAVACTGASYLSGAAREDELAARWSVRAGVPVVTAAHAVCAALRLLGARRIGLASPYPESLNVASEAYWTSRGFEVAAKASAFRETDAFHPIYSLPGGAAQQAVDQLASSGVDAIIMLGTGMPTLRPILSSNADRASGARPPVLSCMLAMTWATIAAADGREPDAADLAAWLTGAAWGGRNRLDLAAG
jgi:maleate isomerase